MAKTKNNIDALHELMGKAPLFEAATSVDMDAILEEDMSVDGSKEEIHVNTDAPKNSEENINLENFTAQPIKKAKEIVDQVTGGKGESVEIVEDNQAKTQARNHVVAKTGVKEYNRMQAGGFAWLFDWLGSPKKMRKRNRELIAKVDTLTENEKKELQLITEEINKHELNREDFVKAIQMDEEAMNVLIECVTDILKVEEVEMNPWSVLIFMIVAQLAGNGVMLWTYTSKLK